MMASEVDPDAALLRHLRGESDASGRSALERRLAADPALAHRLAELQAVWTALELPPPAPVPAGFSGRVAARARGERAAAAGWRRWAPAGALLGGIALGTLGALALPGEEADDAEEITLAESYLDAVETTFVADDPGSSALPAGEETP
jgi:anti-sigma factor RsiW